MKERYIAFQTVHISFIIIKKAYRLECNYADVPMLALSLLLGKNFYVWEESETSMEIVNLLMTSRPMLIERDQDKYFLNIFYSLETFLPSLNLEFDDVNIGEIKQILFNVITRDKDKQASQKEGKLSIYEKLDWMERYLKSKHSCLNTDIVGGGFSGLVSGD